MAILIVSYCFLWRLVVPDSSLVAGEVQLRSSRRRADETPSVVRLVVFPTPRRQQRGRRWEVPQRLGGHHPRKLGQHLSHEADGDQVLLRNLKPPFPP